MVRNGPSRIGMLACAALAAAGIWVGYTEARPYFGGGVLAEERFHALAADRLLPGPSVNSQRLVLDSCVDAITSVYGRTQSSESRSLVYRTCLSVADEVTGTSPAFSYAWYVGSLAAGRSGDVEGMSERLVRSHVTGPTEQWIAELRVELAERYFADLSPEALRGHERDLSLLVRSDRGRRTIARRYARDASFRQRIVPLVEAMPVEDQRRFVQSIESVAGRFVNS